MGRGIIEAKHDTQIYIEVPARHHDQTLPIPFWLLKKPSYSIHTLDDGWRWRACNIIYYDTNTI